MKGEPPRCYDSEDEANVRALATLHKTPYSFPTYYMAAYADEGNNVSGYIHVKESTAKAWIEERDVAKKAGRFGDCKRNVIVSYSGQKWKMVEAFPNTEDGLGYSVIGPWTEWDGETEADGSVQVGDGLGRMVGQEKMVSLCIVASEREVYHERRH